MENTSSKKLVIWLITGVLCILLIILGIWGYAEITKDVLPSAPLSYTKPETLGSVIAKDVLLNNKVVLSQDDFDGVLYQAKESVNKSMNQKGSEFFITELFGEIRENDVILYCRASSGNFPIFTTVVADLQYISPDIEFVVKSCSLGTVQLPVRSVTNYMRKNTMPDNISITGNRICYDTSALNQMIIDSARQNETVSKVESFITGIADFFHMEFRTEEIINLEITGVEIIDKKIVVRTQL